MLKLANWAIKKGDNMKKVLSIALMGATLATGTAHASSRYTPNYAHQIAYANQTAHHANEHAERAQTAAAIALIVATIAVVVAVKASENNPGQIQIARF